MTSFIPQKWLPFRQFTSGQRASEDWLPKAILRAVRKRTLKAGKVLFRSGARTAGLYEIESGQVRLVRIDRRRRKVALYVATAGEILAEESLFSSSYHRDAIAITNVVVRFIPKEAVLSVLKRDPNFARATVARLASEVMTLRMRIERRNIPSARDRLRYYLETNAGDDGRTVLVGGTLWDLATELTLTHEALYRTLAKMAKRGEIKRSKKRMIILKTRSTL
jgi:CRP/FNR family transcriptional regulator, dissimilatory nitrate respiration regulator